MYRETCALVGNWPFNFKIIWLLGKDHLNELENNVVKEHNKVCFLLE